MDEEKLLEVINRMRKRREDAQNKIERLQKEKEWLIRQYLYQIGYGAAKTEKEARERFEEIMQQALKDN